MVINTWEKLERYGKKQWAEKSTLVIFKVMKKLFAFIFVAMVGAAFAEDSSYTDYYAESSSSSSDELGLYEPDAIATPEEGSSSSFEAEGTDTVAAEPKAEISDDSLPELKRCKYTFRSWGLGFAEWHNWKHDVEDSDKPRRDWDPSLMFHHGRIWEMTSHGAITMMINANVAYQETFETQGIATLGGRYFFLNDIYTPYVGGGIGLGLQFDGHLKHFSDKFAFGLAGNIEGGLVIFRTTTTQLELGASYNFMYNVLPTKGSVYGAFNFYLAINY